MAEVGKQWAVSSEQSEVERWLLEDATTETREFTEGAQRRSAGVPPAMSAQREHGLESSRLTARCGRDARAPNRGVIGGYRVGFGSDRNGCSCALYKVRYKARRCGCALIHSQP